MSASKRDRELRDEAGDRNMRQWGTYRCVVAGEHIVPEGMVAKCVDPDAYDAFNEALLVTRGHFTAAAVLAGASILMRSLDGLRAAISDVEDAIAAK